MNKPDLIEYALSLKLDVDDSWTKRQIQDAVDAELARQAAENDKDSSPGETSPGDDETSPGEGEEGPGSSVGDDSPDVDDPGPDSESQMYEEEPPPRIEAYVIRRPGARIPGVIRLPGRRSVEITQF